MSAIPWEEAGRLAFQNLLLLGFDPDEAEKRHGAGISEETFLQPHMAAAASARTGRWKSSCTSCS